MNINPHPCDELEIEVRFHLDSQAIPRSTMQNLSQGQLFQLSSDPDSPVTLSAQGRCFAKGKVFRIGDNVAIRLEELQD